MQAGMNDMLASLQSSVARIGAEGEGAGERMAQQLEKCLPIAKRVKKAMAEQMKAFIDSIQQTSQQGQSETMKQMASSVEALGEKLGSLFTQRAGTTAGQSSTGYSDISPSGNAADHCWFRRTESARC